MVRLSPSFVLTLAVAAGLAGCKTQPKAVELDYEPPPHPSQVTEPAIPAIPDSDLGEPGNLEFQQHIEDPWYYPDFGPQGKFANREGLEILHKG